MEFADKVENLAIQGCIAISLLAAKQLGIFGVLREAKVPLTSQQIADAKKLKERYVRELLGSLMSARLVEISSNGDGDMTYYLQEESKKQIDEKILSKAALFQVIMMRYSTVMACFPMEGPHAVLYDKEYFAYNDEMNSTERTNQRIKIILENVPELRLRLEQGINVIEFGSGIGHLLNKLATMFPKSKFTASEMNDALVSKMKGKCDTLPNLFFETIDLCQISTFPLQKFDWLLAVQVVHDLPHPLVAMENMRRVIAEDGGLCTLLDMGCPANPVACVGVDQAAVNYMGSTFLCIPESFQTEDSEAHGGTWSIDTATSLLRQAEFDVNAIELDNYEALYCCECKK